MEFLGPAFQVFKDSFNDEQARTIQVFETLYCRSPLQVLDKYLLLPPDFLGYKDGLGRLLINHLLETDAVPLKQRLLMEHLNAKGPVDRATLDYVLQHDWRWDWKDLLNLILDIPEWKGPQKYQMEWVLAHGNENLLLDFLVNFDSDIRFEEKHVTQALLAKFQASTIDMLLCQGGRLTWRHARYPYYWRHKKLQLQTWLTQQMGSLR